MLVFYVKCMSKRLSWLSPTARLWSHAHGLPTPSLRLSPATTWPVQTIQLFLKTVVKTFISCKFKYFCGSKNVLDTFRPYPNMYPNQYGMQQPYPGAPPQQYFLQNLKLTKNNIIDQILCRKRTKSCKNLIKTRLFV